MGRDEGETLWSLKHSFPVYNRRRLRQGETLLKDLEDLGPSQEFPIPMTQPLHVHLGHVFLGYAR